MNNLEKHITPWSAEDVRKYLNGQLSPAEMQVLEKAALEDPFLADAIEGLATRTGAPLEQDLGDLQTRLAARVAEGQKRAILLPWMKIAAVIVLMAGLGFTAWFTLLDHSNAKMARSTALHAPLSNHADSTAATHAAAAATSDGVASSAPVMPAGNTTLHKAGAPAQKPEPPLHKAAPSSRTSESSLAGSEPSPQNADLAFQKAEPRSRDHRPPPAAQSSPQAFAANRSRAQGDMAAVDTHALALNDQLAGLRVRPGTSSRLVPDSGFNKKKLKDILYNNNAAYNNLVYLGQVLDFRNRPLANASVLVSGPSNAAATTNALGQFRLNLRPQDSVQRLTVTLAGYQNASLPVNTLNTDNVVGNTIFLRENPNALSEVVVTGAGRRRTETMMKVPSDDRSEHLDSLWLRVTPMTGRQAYQLYLTTGKETLQVDTTIRGLEVVSFAIGPKGIPTDFKIERSLSPAHDAGLIRLITDGAPWKTLRGKNVRAMVSVAFP
ncbi:MAG TPA: carboxypeptidase-like regulatory domain-containing protein [Puia sp.]|nr:carboxypeptidase-like regulatory domain-containing protein [Puia sp.]